MDFTNMFNRDIKYSIISRVIVKMVNELYPNKTFEEKLEMCEIFADKMIKPIEEK